MSGARLVWCESRKGNITTIYEMINCPKCLSDPEIQAMKVIHWQAPDESRAPANCRFSPLRGSRRCRLGCDLPRLHRTRY